MAMQFNEVRLPENIPRRGPKWLSRSSAFILQCRGWRVRGEAANSSKLVIAVAPHTSNWDFFIGVLMMFALRLKLVFFGKHTIFVPPIGGLLKKMGGIPIERGAAHGVVEQIAVQFSQADAMVLALAPEGTRSPVYPWKTGFLHIAKAAGVPVQCVGLDYTHKELVFGPVYENVNDISDTMAQIYQFYGSIPAKYPQQLLTEPKA